MILRNLSQARTQSVACFQWARSKSTFTEVRDASSGPASLLRSMSTDIYENLAMEDWIHDNVDLQNRSILFQWRNSPAVVVGRHQNPWQECNLQLLREKGIPVARRRSGGGTVFHDLGNVNFTFFTSKKNYDRHRNLQVITGALKGLRPKLDVQATERFDILLNGHHKISGSAARLGRSWAYHHCTLLCSSDKPLLSAALKPTCQGISSNATPSVPSPVKNLLEEDPTLDCHTIMDAVATRYNSEFGLRGPVALVDPSDELSFPGIHKLTRELQTWDWTFGKTPKFSISTSFELRHGSSRQTAQLDMAVRSGLIDSCAIAVPTAWLPSQVCEELCSLLVGGRYCPSSSAVLIAALHRTATRTKEVQAKLHTLCQHVVSVM